MSGRGASWRSLSLTRPTKKHRAPGHENQRQGLSHDLARALTAASVEIIDQTQLPHRFETMALDDDGGRGARDPHHAGARRAADRGDGRLWRWPRAAPGRLRRGAGSRHRASRRAAADGDQSALGAGGDAHGAGAARRRRARAAAAYAGPPRSADDDVETCRRIGEHGARADPRHRRRARSRASAVNILTHCNAGWLACVDWGTATAPIYMAHDAGIARACLGRRDAAAQPGRGAHRVRARRARRAAHHHRRQRRRPPDAACGRSTW